MNEFAPCPQCQSTQSERVGFSWWGGVLGPKLLTHVKCPACGTTYNGKTGSSNNTAITIYLIVTCAVGFLLFFVLLKR